MFGTLGAGVVLQGPSHVTRRSTSSPFISAPAVESLGTPLGRLQWNSQPSSSTPWTSTLTLASPARGYASASKLVLTTGYFKSVAWHCHCQVPSSRRAATVYSELGQACSSHLNLIQPDSKCGGPEFVQLEVARLGLGVTMALALCHSESGLGWRWQPASE